MFSLASRAQAISNNTLTVVSAISAAVAVLSLIQLFLAGAWTIDSTQINRVTAQASLKNSRAFGADRGVPKENAKIQFDLAADLTPLFNWNTKQVFVYLTAEYEGKNGGSNKVTFWDKIITSKDGAVFDLKNARSKYSVWDLEKSFRERPANLTLEWNLQPWVGPLIFGKTETVSTFQFAGTKKPKKAKR
ncbi:hypothetical protein JCM33374_g2664 [Metschnikowia sp. JCM 33374]|nr:hypothetical protein JCM33374_g2664 [Metschnikowia sp. JCM 33374]